MNGRSEGEYPALSAFSGGAFSGGLLAVHAHPDDETLSMGGLLATWAAAGRPVRVVTCTRGERGEVIALPGTTSEGLAHLEGDGPALAAYRESELAAALAELGGGDARAIEQSFLDTLAPPDRTASGAAAPSGPSGTRYEDSGMAWVAPGVAGPAAGSPPAAFSQVPLDEPAGRVASLVRAWRPAVVATYEPGGGYGHPDHVRAHQVTVRALELAADPAWLADAGGEPAGALGAGPGRRDQPWAGAELWQVVVPAAELRAARAVLAGLSQARALASAAGLTFADPGEELPPVARRRLDAWGAGRQETGAPDGRPPRVPPATHENRVVRLDVGPVLDRVMGAMRCHATQVQHATALASPEGPVAGWYALSNDVLVPVLATETYLVTAPPG